MNTLERKIISNIFEDILRGVFPKFGSPETKCDKCMFYEVVCLPSPNRIGCYGGWKRETD